MFAGPVAVAPDWPGWVTVNSLRSPQHPRGPLIVTARGRQVSTCRPTIRGSADLGRSDAIIVALRREGIQSCLEAAKRRIPPRTGGVPMVSLQPAQPR